MQKRMMVLLVALVGFASTQLIAQTQERGNSRSSERQDRGAQREPSHRDAQPQRDNRTQRDDRRPTRENREPRDTQPRDPQRQPSIDSHRSPDTNRESRDNVRDPQTQDSQRQRQVDSRRSHDTNGESRDSDRHNGRRYDRPYPQRHDYRSHPPYYGHGYGRRPFGVYFFIGWCGYSYGCWYEFEYYRDPRPYYTVPPPPPPEVTEAFGISIGTWTIISSDVRPITDGDWSVQKVEIFLQEENSGREISLYVASTHRFYRSFLALRPDTRVRFIYSPGSLDSF